MGCGVLTSGFFTFFSSICLCWYMIDWSKHTLGDVVQVTRLCASDPYCCRKVNQYEDEQTGMAVASVFLFWWHIAVSSGFGVRILMVGGRVQ